MTLHPRYSWLTQYFTLHGERWAPSTWHPREFIPQTQVKIYFLLLVINVCFISPFPAAPCVRPRITKSPIMGASCHRVWQILKQSSLAMVLIDLLSTLVVIWSSGGIGVRWICSNVAIVLFKELFVLSACNRVGQAEIDRVKGELQLLELFAMRSCAKIWHESEEPTQLYCDFGECLDHIIVIIIMTYNTC